MQKHRHDRRNSRRPRAGIGWRIAALPALAALTAALLAHQHSTAHQSDRPVLNAAAEPVPAAASSAAPELAAPEHAATLHPSVAKAVNPCANNQLDQAVLVSISRQHAWMCAGQKQVYSTPVTTGETDNGDQTPTGSWDVQAKQTERWLGGDGYSVHVHFWVPFNGDFGFHDATWQTFAFGSQQYRTAGSHGCVHLPIAAMNWFYNWVQPGAGVTVS